jgi:hypothetical protein
VLISLKITMLRKEIKQTRMAADLGWDPAKLSRIMNQMLVPTAEDRKAIAEYLGPHGINRVHSGVPIFLPLVVHPLPFFPLAGPRPQSRLPRQVVALPADALACRTNL